MDPFVAPSANALPEMRERGGAQRHPALAGGVAEMDDHVGDRVQVELGDLGGQLELPLPDRAAALEREVALVAQRRLEEAAVVVTRAGHDRLQRPAVVAEALGLVALARVPTPQQGRAGPDRAPQQRGGARHAGVGADDARHADGRRLDPAEIVPPRVEVEELLRERDRAAARSAQLQQRLRRDLAQADVLGQLVLAAVELVVGELHALEVQQQPLTAEKLLAPGLVAELQEGLGGFAQLALQGSLGPLGRVEGHLEALRVQPADLALHPGVQLPVGALAGALVG